ncbi:hypothetical protein D3C76_1667060 [compost metagenome]
MHAAVYRDHRTGDISRERGTKKRGQISHVFRLAKIADRDILFDKCQARGVGRVQFFTHLFAINPPGLQRIDGNALRRHLSRQPLGPQMQCAFSGSGGV